MARITVEDCLDKVPNRFSLVMLVAKRAKQIMKGAKSTILAKDNKNVVLALREVAKGTVQYENLTSEQAAAEIQEELTR